MKTHITTDSDKYSQGLSYAVNSDNMSYSVVDIGTCNDTDIIIPTKYENLPVTSIGREAFAGCEGLTSITLPNSVTSIDDRAFYGCTELATITLSNSLTIIGDSAFENCTMLTGITIPNSVIYIGDDAFAFCVDLHKSGTFKATDENMCCQHFQYSLNKKYETDCAVLCECGFHFCTNAFDLLNYYSGEIRETVRFFEVKVDKVTEEHSSDSKRVCKEITFLREIKSYAELLN